MFFSNTIKTAVIALSFGFLFAVPVVSTAAEGDGHDHGGATLQQADNWSPRITVEELQNKILRGEKVIILDVRTGGSYDSTKYTIKNSIRMEPQEVKSRAAAEIPKGYEVVTFCT